MKAKIYLAGPLFSQAEIEWAGQLKGRIEEELGDKVEVVWPHQIAAKVAAQSSREIFLSNLAHLEQCPLMVAILDGSQVDDGTAWEVGYHHALFGPLSRIGIRTDFRRAGETDESKVNAMIARMIS
jgi:nucleoside 2-deoxyribosyltransferase